MSKWLATNGVERTAAQVTNKFLHLDAVAAKQSQPAPIYKQPRKNNDPAHKRTSTEFSEDGLQDAWEQRLQGDVQADPGWPRQGLSGSRRRADSGESQGAVLQVVQAQGLNEMRWRRKIVSMGLSMTSIMRSRAEQRVRRLGWSRGASSRTILCARIRLCIQFSRPRRSILTE